AVTAACEAAVFIGMKRVVCGTTTPLAKSPSGLKRWFKRSHRTGRISSLSEAENGTERHTSDGSTVHCAGGPIPERQDDAARGDPRAYRRDPASRHGRGGKHGRRRQQGSASSQDERRTLHCQHQFHGRYLYFRRLSGVG